MKIYSDNGLPFYSADDIRDRLYLSQVLADSIKQLLLAENKAWEFVQIEAPVLIPDYLVNHEYSLDEYYAVVTGERKEIAFSMRPETTAASYQYAQHQLEHQEFRPPYCVWQVSKSFRNENDQVSKNMRFKEFYQQEFQCIFTADTKNDYQKILPVLGTIIADFTGLETRIVTSERLPSYSEKTLDIEVKTTHKWLEVCSCSVRTDVPFSWQDKPLKNVEFAFGLDRLVWSRIGVKPMK